MFTLPEDWAFTPADQIAAQNEAVGAGEYGQVEAIATAPNGDSKVVIAIEAINDQNANQTAAEHAEGLIGEKTKESGIEITSTTIDLPNGTQIPANRFVVPNPGDAPIYSVMASMKDDEKGYFDIVITAFSEEELEEVVAHFGNLNR